MGTNPTFSRREFTIHSLYGAAAMIASTKILAAEAKTYPVRLGGPVFEKTDSPDSWIAALQKLRYRAAYCPVGADAGDSTVNAYAEAAKKADIVIAEVGAWSNPIDTDSEKSRQAIHHCQRQLDLADRIGARCCVNISGSRGPKWDGPHQDNFTDQTFDMIVEVTRAIIDAVQPSRTFFTLETMPWAYPDSPESYLKLINAIDRKAFAAHLDPVNLVCSPQRYYGNAALIRECFEKLGPYIRSCHAKDIILSENLTTHLDETRPGQGGIDYAVFLQELSRLQDVPLMLEHLPSADEYDLAAHYVRSVAQENGVTMM